jgi:hypothetical protein
LIVDDWETVGETKDGRPQEWTLAAFVTRVLFARFDSCGRGDPDDSDEGDEAKSDVWMLKGERDCNEVNEEGKPILPLDRGVFCLKFIRATQASANGQA